MNDESIFAAALTKSSAAERAAYLDEACAGDVVLRSQVEELLAASDDAGSFLNHAPVSSGGTDATIAATRANDDTEKSAEWTGELAFLAPCDTPGRIGKLGHYEIIEVVGRGGMGAVLRAYDTKLSRVVAVKVMAPELAANPMAVKRFLREAKMAAAVHHDHVVTIHEIQAEHRPPYLVMQFVDGQTLGQKIEREGALELAHILRIGSQIAAGLAAAHKHGQVHRDVKPANILLENGVERVKITDFGLARTADDVEVTQAGMIAGTPQYMSPEQAKGETIDMRSDLFSLGSVLYTMCTGRAAFRAETTMGVLKRVCEDQPRPIHEVNPEIPDWLAAIVLKLLAKNPDDRFQSASEVAELLGQHLAHVQSPTLVARPATVVVPVPAVPPLAHPFRPVPPLAAPQSGSGAGVVAIVALVAMLLVLAPFVLIAVGLAVPWMMGRDAPRQNTANFGVIPVDEITAPADEPAQLPPMDLNQWGKLLDPTGNCAVERRPGMAIFHVPGDVPYNLMPGMPLGMNAPRMLREARGNFAIQIRVLPFAKALAGTSTAARNSASWRSAGLVVLGGEETVIRLERVSWGERNAGAPMMHLECFHKGQRIADHYGSITDDERSTLFRIERHASAILCRYSDDGSRWETFRLDQPELPDQVLLGLAVVHTTPTVFDTAFEDLRFQSGESLAAGNSDPQPLLIAELVAAAPRISGWGASWSPDGKRLVRSRRSTDELEIIDLATRETRVLYAGGADPAWSPRDDGPIAFVRGTQLNDATKEELWLIEPDGTNPRKLCAGGYPSWSRDGTRLFFRDHSGTSVQLRSIDPANPASEPVVHALDQGAGSYPAASPDGTMVAYGIGKRLVVTTLAQPRLVASVDLPGWNGILPCWSPDSRYVSFGSFGWSDNRGAWLLDTRTGEARLLAAGSLTLPRWSPDGTKIAVDERSKSEMLILDVTSLSLDNGLSESASQAASPDRELVVGPWTPLFNGTDLAGWKAHPLAARGWTAHENTLMGRGGNEYLYTTRDDYQDFRIRAEVKIMGGADSGILLRMAPPADKEPAESGYEVQLAGNPDHVSPTASIIRHGSSVGRQLASGRGDLIRLGEWFAVEIAAIGNDLSIAIDGKEIVSVHDPQPRTSGHIALQSLSDSAEVRFRKLEVQELTKPLPAEQGSRSMPPAAIAPFDADQAKQHQDAWAKYLGIEPEFTNSIGMKFRLIPPGEFTMGSNPEEIPLAIADGVASGGLDEDWLKRLENSSLPRHVVRLTRPLRIGECEVTVAQFREFVRATGYQTTNEQHGKALPNWHAPEWEVQDDQPVTHISWQDAQAFCRWLSATEKRRYDLPTEAQWEFACRSGTQEIWTFGDDPAELYKFAWHGLPADSAPMAVGQKQPNGFGLFDMYGNAQEWCLDRYEADYYGRSPLTDPACADSEGAQNAPRVVRGGWWRRRAHLLRSAARSYGPASSFFHSGFRVALVDDLLPESTATGYQ